jgi:methyl-accepting chemotaxis protein
LLSVQTKATDDQFTHLIADVRTMMTHIGDTSNLVLDPDLDSYYLMDVTLLGLPQLQDRLQEILVFLSDFMKIENRTKDREIQLAVYTAMLHSDLDRVVASTKTSVSEDDNFYGMSNRLQSEVPKAMVELSSKVEAFFEQLKLISAGKASDDVLKIGTEALRFSFVYWDTGVDVLDHLFVQRVDDFKGEKRAQTIWVIFYWLFAGCLAYFIQRSVTDPLKRILKQLDEISSSSSDTSHRLMESSQKSNHSTSQQAAAIQETVASMAQMTSMLEQTAQYSKNANDMAYDVSRETTSGTVTMQKMASAMDVISSANNRLQDITKIIEDITRCTNVINDIVFKTQLLSVNAAIEAARAGQHGKGFAVVANEVGNLANMSGKAANEIRNLLNDSRSQVSQIVGNTDDSIRAGQGVTHEAIKTFDKISKSMTVISERVGQINEATREQETGVKQTSMAMNQMNETTARNSSIARENASLSENLKHQSLKLTKIGSAMNFVVLGYQGEKKVKPKKISPIDALLGNDSEDEPSVSATRTSSKRSSSTIMSDTTDSENTSNHEGMSTGSTQSSFGDRKDGLIARLLKKADDFKSQQAKESRNSIDSSASEATQDDHKEMAHLTVVDMAHDKKSKKSKHNTDKSA